MPEFKKEWLDKASLDYFAPFILLWLGFNSWYRSHYSDLEGQTDRNFIDTLKTDFTGRNQPYRKFCALMGRPDKVGTEFRSDLEMLYRAFHVAALVPERIKYLGMHKALINYAGNANEGAYKQLIKIGKRRSVKYDKLQHDLVIIKDNEKIFAGLLECIYQFRHMLVHGHVEPSPENHEVSKYCHNVLLALME